MLKQRRNSDFKKSNRISKRKPILKANIFKKQKNFLRVRKSFRDKCQANNPTFRFISGKGLKFFEKLISIKIKPNNVFCALSDRLSGKTIYITSSGKCQIKTSKKMLRFSSKLILQSFFNNIKPLLKREGIIVRMVGPKRLKKPVVEQLTTVLRGKSLLITSEGKKCFNGCRAPKKRRKKQRGMRIFK